MPATGLTSTSVNRLAVGPAVVYRGASPIGVSIGDVVAEETVETRQPRIGGLTNPIADLDRVVSSTLRITGTFLERSAAQTALARSGGTVATVGAVVNVTPPAAGYFLGSGQYDADIRIVIKKGDGGLFRAHMPRALQVGGLMAGGDPDEAGTTLTWEARSSPNTPDVAGYTYELVASEDTPPDETLPPAGQLDLVLAMPLDMGGGAQTIVALIGPDGVLGSTTGVDTNDPTHVAGPPASLSFGVDDYVDHGNVLDSTFTGAAGFTLLVCGNPSAGDIAAAVAEILTRASAAQKQFQFLLVGGDLWFECIDSASNFGSWRSDDPTVAGRRVWAVTFDPTLSGAARLKFYDNGVLKPATFGGTSTAPGLISTTAELHAGLGDDIAETAITGTGPYYVFDRPLTGSEVADNTAWLQAAGWA